MRLKSERGLCLLSCLFTESDRWFKILCYIAERIYVREKRPGKGELWVKAHRFLEIFLRPKGVNRVVGTSFQCISQPTQVGIISLGIVCRFGGDDLLLLTSEFRPQLVGNCLCHLTLDRKDVGQFAIEGIGPKMRIIGCFD